MKVRAGSFRVLVGATFIGLSVLYLVGISQQSFKSFVVRKASSFKPVGDSIAAAIQQVSSAVTRDAQIQLESTRAEDTIDANAALEVKIDANALKAGFPLLNRKSEVVQQIAERESDAIKITAAVTDISQIIESNISSIPLQSIDLVLTDSTSVASSDSSGSQQNAAINIKDSLQIDVNKLVTTPAAVDIEMNASTSDSNAILDIKQITAVVQNASEVDSETLGERKAAKKMDLAAPLKETEREQPTTKVSTVSDLQRDVLTPISQHVRPGSKLRFEGTYESGGMTLELVGHMHFPSRVSEEVLQSIAKTEAGDVVHLHLRLGSAPLAGVANTATPGGGWMLEEPVNDVLHGQSNIAVAFDIVFGQQDMELRFKGERLILFRYRFNPLDMEHFRFLCRSGSQCMRDAQLHVYVPEVPAAVNCFADFCTPPQETVKHPAPSADGILHSLYINLAHREDRKAAIEAQLTAANIPFERLEAVNPRKLPDSAEVLRGCFDEDKCPGQVGCQLSHLKALKQAMDAGLEHVAIFEDDFTFQPFVNLSMVQSAVNTAMRMIPDWDVIALSLNIASETLLKGLTVQYSDTMSAGVTWLHNAQTTGGYIVRRSMMPRIYDSFLPSNCLVKRDYMTAIDQCWKLLQIQTLWLAFEPQPGTQAKSYSDIEGRDVNYDLTR